MKKVLILKAGNANPAVRVGIGDYDRWFVQTLSGQGHAFEVVNAHLGEKLPGRGAGHDAVIMTGSPSSVTAQQPWMARAADFMRDAAQRRVPVLGVCFGHQLLAHAFGSRVVRNPQGREIGTIRCQLTAAGKQDPLFEGVAEQFEIQATHEDLVVDEPAELRLLASNPNTRNQAFAAGDYLRAVQFHPEADAATLRALIEARAAQLVAEAAQRGQDGAEHLRALLSGIRPAPSGKRILENFLRHFG